MNDKHLCTGTGKSGNTGILSTTSQVIITDIICSLVSLTLGMFLGGLIYHCIVRHKDRLKLTSDRPTPPPASVRAIYEEVSPDSHMCIEKRNDIELSENAAYESVTK